MFRTTLILAGCREFILPRRLVPVLGMLLAANTFALWQLLLVLASAEPLGSTLDLHSVFSPAHARRRVFPSIRKLQSDQCTADTTILYEKSASLQEATRAFDSEYDAAVEACGSRRICTINEDNFDATPRFVQECETAGGAIYEYDMTVRCNLSDGEEVITVVISYLNVDRCYDPQSCDEKAIARHSGEEADSDREQFEQVFSSETSKSVCNIQYTVSDSEGNVVIAEIIEGEPESSTLQPFTLWVYVAPLVTAITLSFTW